MTGTSTSGRQPRRSAGGFFCTDDCQLFEAMGREVQLVLGDYRNLKLTTPEDFLAAGAYLEGLK